MKVQPRVRRPLAGVVLAVVMASSVLTACQVAKAGAKCRTTEFGRDNGGYVLQCKAGRWRRIMTIRDYLLLVKRIQDAQANNGSGGGGGGGGGGSTPTPVGASPQSSWNLVGDVNVNNADTVDGVDDGIGYAAALIGNTAFVGGSFSQITNGTTTLGRGNVAAFDITTDQPTGFVANTNGKVTSLATDGTKLFVGGTFTIINGQVRNHFAVLDPGTGTVYGGGWEKDFQNNVYSLSVSGTKLYVGGAFNGVSGTTRQRAAALSLADGSLDPSFHPAVLGNGVDSIAAAADDSTVYIGGTFTSVNGNTGPGTTNLVELDGSGNVQHAGTGFVGVDSPALDLKITAGNGVLVALGGDDNEVARYAAGGARQWTTGDLCPGDAQAVHQVGNTVYAGFHQSCKDSAGNADATYHLVKLSDSGGGSVETNFKAVFDGYWGVWGLEGNGTALVAVGQFDHVNGANHKGFVIFKPAP